MLLVRQGRISLDDSISNYFDDLPPPWKSITIRQLLSHTAGLPRESPLFNGLSGHSLTQRTETAICFWPWGPR